MNSYLPLYCLVPSNFSETFQDGNKIRAFPIHKYFCNWKWGGGETQRGKKSWFNLTHTLVIKPRLSNYPSRKPYQLRRLTDTHLYYIPYTNTRLLTSPDVHQAFFFAQLFTSSGMSFSTSLSFLKTQPLPRGPPLTARLTSNTRLEKIYLYVSLPTGR